MIKKHIITPPADVPRNKHHTYMHNYQRITHNTHRLLLFAFDQKIEHLHADFYGETVHDDAADPRHAFEIAANGTIGAFATHVGLIARYGLHYPSINYLVKLNAKTPLIAKEIADPISAPLYTVDDVFYLQKTNALNICGIGITVYPGSTHEHTMLSFAAQQILHAHQHGLITILWVYPRGKSVTQENDPLLLAGAVGLANSLGADFVKIKTSSTQTAAELNMIIRAAGNTKVLFSGGEQVSPQILLNTLYQYLHHGFSGCAVGRNIFQRERAQAIALTHALAALTYKNQTVDEALSLVRASCNDAYNG